MRDANHNPPSRRSAASTSWIAHLPAGILGVCAALLNATITGAAFPSFTVLSTSDEGILVALAAGVLIAAAIRFPLAALVIQSMICICVAAVPSLSSAAFIAGTRLGARSPLAVASAGISTLIFTAAPWLPTGTRFSAALVVLLPFALGTLGHTIRRQRHQRDERLLLHLQNAALIDERSALRERERMADELHDRLGHHLTAIEIQARLVLESRVSAEAFEHKVALMRSQAAMALNDMRSITLAPAKPVEEPSIPPAEKSTERQLRDFAEALNVHVQCSHDGSFDELAPPSEYIVLRLLQEGLTNAARHAPGETVRISMRGCEDGIRITMQNPSKGPGFSTQGRGLRSLKRRFAQAGGTLTVRITSAQHFSLDAFLPDPSPRAGK